MRAQFDHELQLRDHVIHVRGPVEFEPRDIGRTVRIDVELRQAGSAATASANLRATAPQATTWSLSLPADQFAAGPADARGVARSDGEVLDQWSQTVEIVPDAPKRSPRRDR
jgi:hypothetical protein